MKSLLLGAAALSLSFLASCTAGPSYLSRTVDDWQNRHYEENPFMASIMSDVLPGYFIAKAIAAIPDYLILNPVQFWAVDIWRGEGVGFQHKNPPQNQEAWFINEIPGTAKK